MSDSATLQALQQALKPKTGMQRVPFPLDAFVLEPKGIPWYGHDMAYVNHGMTGHPFLRVWKNMLQRTMNKNSKQYKDYGGRGITVCERWMSFLNFKEDMFSTYQPDLFIDRVDNDGPYSPENCRWVTRVQQNSNRRPGATWNVGRKPISTNTSGYVGVFWSTHKKRWISTTRVNGRLKQVGTFDTPEEAAEAYQRVRNAIREGRMNV
jgi:hypothetical protein